MRFSLFGGFVAVAMLALACVGMKYRTTFWVSAVMSASLALYAVMIIRAIALQGPKRVSVAAFAIVGGCYLLLAATTAFRVQEFLITNYPNAWTARLIGVSGTTGPMGGGLFSVPSELGFSAIALQQFGGNTVPRRSSLDHIIAAATTSAPYSDELQKFFLVAHCVWSWTFGLLAAWLADSWARRPAA